jgi:CDP-glycerol glycerophosphotransferase (TagB/SpsB family)
MASRKRLFISADHGLALIYFLQSDVVATLLQGGVEVVLLTEDSARAALEQRFHQPGLIFEGLRLDQCQHYYRTVKPSQQRWLYLLRWAGGSRRINTTAIEGNYHLSVHGVRGRTRFIIPFIRALILLMRLSRPVRQAVVNYQNRFTPSIYADLFEKYQPALVVASTPGWRFDRYLLREAAARHIPTASVIVGWDNPSSYRLCGAPVNWITCWSEIQKEELVLGADWKPEQVHIGGIPSYDGYFRKSWLIPRQEYFRLHGLDPQRKLLSYAASFVTFAPNFPNMSTLAELVASDALDEPCQLLIRLHPNHFRQGSIYEAEAQRIRAFVRDMPHVHIVEPVPLSGGLGHYSGEDMPEKASMMAYSDVFLTVYSTMVVETAIHDRPIVSVCIDAPHGWNSPKVYSLPLTAIGEWPTHKRFRQSGAGRVATNRAELREQINFYLKHPQADAAARRRFVQEECTFTDGSAGRRTGEYLLSLLERRP